MEDLGTYSPHRPDPAAFLSRISVSVTGAWGTAAETIAGYMYSAVTAGGARHGYVYTHWNAHDSTDTNTGISTCQST